MSKGLSAIEDDIADPDIRRFVDAINAAYVEHAAPAGASMAVRRAVAERVRRPWREGGPIMAETHEMDMDGVRLRLHRPVADQKLPVMLYIHGGGWTLFSIDTHDRLMREYAARAGIAVLGIDYSLSPESKFPVALEECAAVDIEHHGELFVRDRTVEAQADAAHVHFARLGHYRATLAPRPANAFGDLAAHRHARPGGSGMFDIGGVDRIDETADIGVGHVFLHGVQAL